MQAVIKIQHLASVKETVVSLQSSLTALKEIIQDLFAIPVSQQALMLGDRNISTSTKMLVELGLRDGSIIVVKKIHQVGGKSQGGDIASLMKNPMVKGMIKNPSMLKSIQDMFPDLKEEMGNNKTLNMIMNNGGLEDEIEKLSGDSEYMNAQLRNADLTLAKLENIPGGINMMSGMMKDVEDPFKIISISPGIKGGNKISEKITSSIPGNSKINYAVEYRKQLAELRQIGFENTRENIEILKHVNGELQDALEILMEKHNSL